jgi:plastocyanin
MEYVQLTLAQMPADRLEEALKPGGLLDRLDRHRQELQRQPGFRDMRVVRSINRQGNVQLVVETRWADDQSLIDYETGQTTVASILEEFRHLLVPGSLQVVDMEALRSEEWWRQLEAERSVRERAVLPLLLPAGVFLFAVLVIYGLSRIYLELAHWKVGDVDAASLLALGISALILGVGWFVATRPRIRAWQVGGIAAVALLGILAGAIGAAVHQEGGEVTTAVAEKPPAAATSGPQPGAGGPSVVIKAVPTLKFDRKTLEIPANVDVTIRFINEDTGVPHNFAAYKTKEAKEALAVGELCTAPCENTITVNVPPGKYFFRCDIHPVQMVGDLIAR